MDKEKEWQMGVSFSDTHIPFQDNKALDLVFAFIKVNQPDYIVINGDLCDFWEISKFDKVPKAGKTLKEELEETADILKLLRKIAPNSQITIIEGNHEFRLRKYIISRAREIYGLKGLNIQDQLGLKELNINYKECLPGLNKFSHNDIQIGDLYIGHYDKASKYSIANLVEQLGVSFIQGHDHRFSVYSKSFRDGRELIGIGQGCLSSLSPNYVSFPNWQQGFSVFYKKVDKPRFQVYPVRIPDYRFIYSGEEFNLDKAHKILYA